MFWNTSGAIWIKQMGYASCNQHGMRYKKTGNEPITVGRLEADVNNAIDLRDLILISNMLSVPVHYDFEVKPQKAYIEIVSAEKLRSLV